MVKKMPRTPRPAQRIVETDVVTRVSAHDINHRAYERFQQRGREHGHDIDDWLVAEAELVEGRNPSGTARIGAATTAPVAPRVSDRASGPQRANVKA